MTRAAGDDLGADRHGGLLGGARADVEPDRRHQPVELFGRDAGLDQPFGASCEGVDRAARDVIAAAGFGEYFVHRTGHGIGMEAHEEPYMVSGNTLPIAAGHAFSVEPGIYIPGKWGMRLEDIVVATDAGPVSMNSADHRLVSVRA